jgi:hypothetical protein
MHEPVTTDSTVHWRWLAIGISDGLSAVQDRARSSGLLPFSRRDYEYMRGRGRTHYTSLQSVLHMSGSMDRYVVASDLEVMNFYVDSVP